LLEPWWGKHFGCGGVCPGHFSKSNDINSDNIKKEQ
jgi:hypothetical protein